MTSVRPTEPARGGRGPVMPALFVGHGNPMNAIETNRYTEAWRTLASSIPRPRAILCVSAHWYVRGTRVGSMEKPRTIHDFGGFPEALFRVEYPAPGDPALARRIAEMLRPTPVELDESWGLDHGAWSILVRMFPGAEIPVVQVSLDRTAPPTAHYEIARRLGPLRDVGVLVLGSGNLVHNLHAYSWGGRPAQPYDWAIEFERRVRSALDAGNPESTVAYDTMGTAAEMSVPTPDHYLPFLYAIAVARPGERFSYPVDGFDGGSISMLAVRVG